MNSNQRAHAILLIKNRPHMGDKVVARFVGRGIGYETIKKLRREVLDETKPAGYLGEEQEQK